MTVHKHPYTAVQPPPPTIQYVTGLFADWERIIRTCRLKFICFVHNERLFLPRFISNSPACQNANYRLIAIKRHFASVPLKQQLINWIFPFSTWLHRNVWSPIITLFTLFITHILNLFILFTSLKVKFVLTVMFIQDKNIFNRQSLIIYWVSFKISIFGINGDVGKYFRLVDQGS